MNIIIKEMFTNAQKNIYTFKHPVSRALKVDFVNRQ